MTETHNCFRAAGGCRLSDWDWMGTWAGPTPVAKLLSGPLGVIPESAAQSTTPMMDRCQLDLPRQTDGGTIW